MRSCKSSKRPRDSATSVIEWALAGRECSASMRLLTKCRPRCWRPLASPRKQNSRVDRRRLLAFLASRETTCVETLRQQTENRDAIWGPHVNSSVDDDRRNEFVAAEVVAIISGLIGIVEFRGEIGGVVRKQDCTAIFYGPDDCVGGAFGRDAWRRPGEREMMRGLR